MLACRSRTPNPKNSFSLRLVSWLPHTCESLGFGDLFRSHLCRDCLSVLGGLGGPWCGKGKPHVSGDVVLLDPLAGGIAGSQVQLGYDAALVCGELVPPDRLGVILGNAAAFGIRHPKVGLRSR